MKSGVSHFSCPVKKFYTQLWSFVPRYEVLYPVKKFCTQVWSFVPRYEVLYPGMKVFILVWSFVLEWDSVVFILYFFRMKLPTFEQSFVQWQTKLCFSVICRCKKSVKLYCCKFYKINVFTYYQRFIQCAPWLDTYTYIYVQPYCTAFPKYNQSAACKWQQVCGLHTCIVCCLKNTLSC
jgi:hypothetical protein